MSGDQGPTTGPRVPVPEAVALGCAVAALLVLAGTAWFAGGQHSVVAQWQFVLVALGLGLGLVVLAGVLHTAARRQQGERRIEQALVRLLRATAQLPPPPRPPLEPVSHEEPPE